MARKLEEWVGDTDDTKIPDRVKVRILNAAAGRCQSCGALLCSPAVEFDHKVALINWRKTPEAPHGNRESNIWAIGAKCCHKKKTQEDVAEKKRVYKKRKHYSGVKTPSGRPVPGSRRSKTGTRYNRETGRFEAYWRD